MQLRKWEPAFHKASQYDILFDIGLSTPVDIGDSHRVSTVVFQTEVGATLPDALSKADYEALAEFRYIIRRFLHFSAEGSRQVGLTPQQHQILLAIKGRPDRDWATISELAEAMQLRHHAAVGLVDRCEATGMVRRTPDMDDRRQVRVSLTEKGEQTLAWMSQRNLNELRTLRQALHVSLTEALGDIGSDPEP